MPETYAVILEAMERYGSPLYLFDEGAFQERCLAVRERLGSHISLCYAMKANPFFLRVAQTCVDCFEVCSPGEFHICEQGGVDGERIVLSGVYKSAEEIDHAMTKHADKPLYTVESPRQYEIIRDAARRHGLRCRVLPRLSSGNKFGMDRAALLRILEKSRQETHITVAGVHFFSGTQKKCMEQLDAEAAFLTDICAEAECLGTPLERVQYGAGLPVPYFAAERITEDSDWADRLVAALVPLTRAHRVVVELGRYLTAHAGVYATRVVDMKRTGDKLYCLVDGGIHHINYFGQMLGLKQPPVEVLPSGRGEAMGGEWIVGGALCTDSDLLLKKFRHEALHCGDVFVFRDIGAYSVTEPGYLFLSRDLPAVALRHPTGTVECVRGNMPTWPLNALTK